MVYSHDKYLQAIEQDLHAAIDTFVTESSLYAEFNNMLRYHLGWTDAHGRAIFADAGKRLRPLLCLLSCQAAGGDWHTALPVATAIELVHNFSLIHDDIQDHSTERRGRPALWTVWGHAQGINAGDALFVLARLALDRIHDCVAPSAYAAIHKIFDAATLALTQGQFLDLSLGAYADITIEDYLQMVGGKTAALLSAATALGARIAADETRMVNAFASYGENLGIAFQIADDILGIWGDPTMTGKSASGDILEKKKSLPLLAAMQFDTSGELASLFAKESLSPIDVDTVRAILERAHARDFSQAQAENYLQRALDALETTALANLAIEQLRQIAYDAVQREK